MNRCGLLVVDVAEALFGEKSKPAASMLRFYGEWRRSLRDSGLVNYLTHSGALGS
jgi:hypothetical protein